MKKVGVNITPLARALDSSAATRACAPRALSLAAVDVVEGRRRARSATAAMSSSVSISERLINVT